MKLLIDANILLDVLQDRKPHVHASAVVWKLCETGAVKGCVSALTFANLVYIMRKEMSPEKMEETLRMLSLLFESVDFCAADLLHAAELNWENFEDAVQSVTAERIHADYIITRNVEDFVGSKVNAYTPSELIARM